MRVKVRVRVRVKGAAWISALVRGVARPSSAACPPSAEGGAGREWRSTRERDRCSTWSSTELSRLARWTITATAYRATACSHGAFFAVFAHIGSKPAELLPASRPYRLALPSCSSTPRAAGRNPTPHTALQLTWPPRPPCSVARARHTWRIAIFALTLFDLTISAEPLFLCKAPPSLLKVNTLHYFCYCIRARARLGVGIGARERVRVRVRVGVAVGASLGRLLIRDECP